MPTYIALDEGLKAFIVALVNDEVVPADENVLAARLAGTGHTIDPKDVRAIMNFATSCGYLEKLGSQLVFTKLARDRANKYKTRREGLSGTNATTASESGFVPMGM